MTSQLGAHFLLRIFVLAIAALSLAHARPEEQVDLEAFSLDEPMDPHMLEEFEEVVTSAPLEEEQEEPAVEEEEEEAVPRPYPVHDVYPKKVTDETYPKKFQEGVAAQEEAVPEPEQVPEEPLPEEEEEAQPEAPDAAEVPEDQVEETASPQPETEDEEDEAILEEPAAEEEAPAEEPPAEEEEAAVEEEAAAEEEAAPVEEETAVEEEPEADGGQSPRSDVEEDGGPQEYQPEPAPEESEAQEQQPEPEEPAKNETQVEQPEDAQEPVVMPVTEGKNRSGQDAGSSYDLPKELMPIHPGGGSKFEDLEQERLDKTKMSQTKGDDEDTENGNAHNAEGLYSSCSGLHAPLLLLPLAAVLVRKLV